MNRLGFFFVAVFTGWVYFISPVFASHEPTRFQSVEPDHTIFSVDVYAEVQSRDVVEKGGQLMGLKVNGDAVSTRLLTRLALRPVPPFELYGLVGGADLSIDEFDSYDARLDFAWGAGFRFIVFESQAARASRFFLDYQYLQFTTQDRVETNVGPQDDEIFWTEHVVKVGGGFRHDLFNPYGGLRFSIVRGEDRLSQSGELTLEEDDNIGLFGGMNIALDPNETVAFNVEASIIDVNSIRFGLRFSF